ncbi:MAG: tetratricopeptide repeat protein [Candidatus Desulfofervidaceae bacterium]|nr:tetratricopeptide repeat protein [Candidatus Desulfofervidaceae bacterium]MDL1970446.1 tetratricopeptide repeat protein [Candidatus Desulfofervidaceae bacterium]
MRWLSYLCCIFLFINCVNCASSIPKKEEADVYFHLGDSYLREGKYIPALQELLKAVKLDPQNPDIHLELGLAYMGRGNLSTAESEFKKALQLRPNYAAVYNNLGLLYLRQKKWQQAEKSFKKALDIATYPTPEVAYTNLGSCYVLQHKYTQAEGTFRSALEINPRYLPAYVGLGGLWETLNQQDKALKVYQQGIYYIPDAATLYFRMAMIYLNKGERPKARECLEKTIQFDNGALRQHAQKLLETF